MSKKTPSFIHEIVLKTTPQDRRVLDVRFDKGRQLYNACLGESLRCLDLMRESNTYQAARKVKSKNERQLLFKEARKENGFSEYNLHGVCTGIRNNCDIKKHVDSSTSQKIATRAFNAVNEHAFGKRGRPRFKGKGRFRSVEGKSNKTGIRFKDGKIHWSGLELEPLYDKKDKHAIQAHALSHDTKYVRLVKKIVNGKPVFFMQLVQEGTPAQKKKNTTKEGTVGLDIGPSTIAVVSSCYAFLTAFCVSLGSIENQIRRLHRLLDRSKRKMNPDNYNDNNTVKKGKRRWHFSSRYRKNKAKLAELNRRHADTRKRLHGEMANQILRLGNQIRAEKLSYRSFQKNYGKSVSKRAPGTFIKILRDKAERAGGKVTEFSTYKTKLSQTCHGCGSAVKKPLSERWHNCACGIGPAQRDLYSAYLARFVSNDCLDKRQAQKAWPGAEPLLGRALSRLNESATGKLRVASFGLSKIPSQSALHVKEGSTPIEAVDVVGIEQSMPESHGEMCGTALRTPCL